MGSSTRKGVVLALIAVMHMAAIAALMNVKRPVEHPTLAPMQATVIAPSTENIEREPPKPVELKSLQVDVHVVAPTPIEFELAAEASERAISVPLQVAAADIAPAERGAPKLIETVEYVREPSPRYPPQSRKLREQGLVMLRVLIDEKGAACSIEIETSSGYARLDHAAREAVARAAFRPYVEDGAPRRALVLIPIEFSLGRTSA